MTSRWLDVARFPGRAHLAAIARDHRPTAGFTDLRAAALEALQARWATALGASPDDLLLFASAQEAARLACSALMAPGDLALLARPATALWPAAVLATGAAFVDLGRLADGRLDPAGVAFAAEAHAGALWLLDQPSLTGHDDLATWSAALDEAPRPPSPARALLDVTDAPGHGASAATLAPVDVRAELLASLHALRDPLEPAWPLLFALRVQPGEGRALAALRGPATLPMPLVERASLVWQRADMAADAHAAIRISAVRAEVAARAERWPGAAVVGTSGWRIAVRCDGGDAEALAAELQASGLPAMGHGRHPMRSLVVVDLGVALQLGRDRFGAAGGA